LDLGILKANNTDKRKKIYVFDEYGTHVNTWKLDESAINFEVKKNKLYIVPMGKDRIKYYNLKGINWK